jgi:multidrug efflux pump subunit AcrA (membrane-fusion protein)
MKGAGMLKKWRIIFGIVIVVAGIGVCFFAKGKEKSAKVRAQTDSAQKGKLEVKENGSGTVQPAASTDIKATANIEVDEALVSKG